MGEVLLAGRYSRNRAAGREVHRKVLVEVHHTHRGTVVGRKDPVEEAHRDPVVGRKGLAEEAHKDLVVARKGLAGEYHRVGYHNLN